MNYISNDDFFSDKRIHNPILIRCISDKKIRYKYAVDMANKINIKEGERYFSFISGHFIMGDFIEAYLVEKNIAVKEMTISTLSLSQANVDSLKNLLVGGYVAKLNLIVSDYFFAHERHTIVKYIYEQLDFGNKFQFSVCRSHTKTVIFETDEGLKIVLHGSANLRSSDNVEQIDIEENKSLYDYIYEFQSKLLDKYKTINKSIKQKEVWQSLEEVEVVEANLETPQQGREPQRKNNLLEI